MDINLSKNSTFSFKNVLKANAFFSGLCGLYMIIFHESLSQWIGLNLPLVLKVIGIGLVLFAIMLVGVIRSTAISRALAYSIIIGDVSWVISSAVLLLSFSSLFTVNGLWLITLTAFVVSIFASLQYRAIVNNNSKN